MKNFKDYKYYTSNNFVEELKKRLDAASGSDNIIVTKFKEYSNKYLELLDAEMLVYYNKHPEVIKRTSAGNIRKNYSVDHEYNRINLWNRNFGINYEAGMTYINGWEWHHGQYRITSDKQLEIIAKTYAEYQVKSKVFEYWNKFDKIKSKKKKPLLQAKATNDIKKHAKTLVGKCGIKYAKITGEITSGQYKNLVLKFDDNTSTSLIICNSRNPLTIYKHLVKYNEDTIPKLVEYLSLRTKLELKNKELKKLGISPGWSKYG
jgi:hypothetical protein